jgi:hypothetical protein
MDELLLLHYLNEVNDEADTPAPRQRRPPYEFFEKSWSLDEWGEEQTLTKTR